jgi:tetratricopeptide (TPR) repeat protein
MSKTPPLGAKADPSRSSPDDTLDTGFFEVTPGGAPKHAISDAFSPDVEPTGEATVRADLPDEPLADSEAPGGRPPRRRPSRTLMIAVASLAACLVLGGVFLLLHRDRQRRALREGMARAAELMRLDTYAGYSAAADLLKSLVPLDSLEAGSARAFALSMLVTDYRDETRAGEAEALLVEPERAAAVPVAANLAEAALLLPREAGTATTFAARAPTSPWSGVIQARVAIWAGNLPAAADLVNGALGMDPSFPAALALKGDIMRRRKDYPAAREAYAAALRTSPTHARATLGMAKLALSDKAPREEAIPPLERLLSDQATRPNERARAALHLAALRSRAGDRPGAAAAIDAAQVSPASRLWLEKAVSEEELSRGGYRVVANPPPALQSAQDDDPYEPPPPSPPVLVPPKPALAAPSASAAPAKHVKAVSKPSKTRAATAKVTKTKKPTTKAAAKSTAKTSSKTTKKKTTKKKTSTN